MCTRINCTFLTPSSRALSEHMGAGSGGCLNGVIRLPVLVF
jgi:hypothetical protein